MHAAPGRSLGETISQLVVIVILIAIVVGGILFIRNYVDTHNANSASSAKATYNFTCCTAFDTTAVYHPGENVKLSWTPVESLPGDYPKRTITLTALLSAAFPSVKALKAEIKSGAFSYQSGKFTAAAGQVKVSNRSGDTPHMTIHIPGNARTGYYDLVTTASQKNFSNTAGLIIEIRR